MGSNSYGPPCESLRNVVLYTNHTFNLHMKRILSYWQVVHNPKDGSRDEWLRHKSVVFLTK